MTLTKLDANTIVKVGTQEVRQIYTRDQLVIQVERLTARLAEMQELLTELDK